MRPADSSWFPDGGVLARTAFAIRRRLISLAPAVLVPAGCVLLGEGAVRLVSLPLAPFREITMFVDDGRHYVPTPNRRIAFRGMTTEISPPVTWEFNAQGIRGGSLVSPAPPPGRIRLATYGDSEAFGWAVDLEERC
ncbi:MAG: hypothetical protein WCC53_13965 [Thermoanaerobaculia bacterium]